MVTMEPSMVMVWTCVVLIRTYKLTINGISEILQSQNKMGKARNCIVKYNIFFLAIDNTPSQRVFQFCCYSEEQNGANRLRKSTSFSQNHLM